MKYRPNKYSLATTLLDDAYAAWLKAGAVLNKLNRGAEIDEVAIVCANEDELRNLVLRFKTLGLDHFNSVPRDTMQRAFHAQHFDVRFEFLMHPRQVFRLECMAVLDGRAPLHERALERSHGEPCIIHASYKVDNAEDYAEEHSRLYQDASVMHHATYTNSYGRFSYWKAWELPDVYLKPRVNLRDSSAHLQLSDERPA